MIVKISHNVFRGNVTLLCGDWTDCFCVVRLNSIPHLLCTFVHPSINPSIFVCLLLTIASFFPCVSFLVWIVAQTYTHLWVCCTIGAKEIVLFFIGIILVLLLCFYHAIFSVDFHSMKWINCQCHCAAATQTSNYIDMDCFVTYSKTVYLLDYYTWDPYTILIRVYLSLTLDVKQWRRKNSRQKKKKDASRVRMNEWIILNHECWWLMITKQCDICCDKNHPNLFMLFMLFYVHFHSFNFIPFHLIDISIIPNHRWNESHCIFILFHFVSFEMHRRCIQKLIGTIDGRKEKNWNHLDAWSRSFCIFLCRSAGIPWWQS